MKKYRNLLIISAVLIGAVFLASSNVFDFAYLYDDEFLLQKNKFLNSFDHLFAIFRSASTGGAGYSDSFYRPIQIVFYLITEQIFGHETWAFHLLNLTLHSANAILVFVMGSRLRLPTLYAAGAALLWALHPIHTEAVTYMSATADPLHTMFILTGLLVVFPKFGVWRTLAGMLLFAAALCSKEAAVVFPALLVTLIFLEKSDRWNWRSYLVTVPFWIEVGGYLILRKTVLNFQNDFSMYKVENIYTQNMLYRVYTFWATLPNYLELLIWPHDLHMDRAFSVYVEFFTGEVLLGFGICVTAVFALYQVFRNRGLPMSLWGGWAALWFMAAYTPSSGILIPVNSLFLEHWMYLPSIGLFIGSAAGIEYFLRKKKVAAKKAAMVVCLFAAIALGVATHEQNWVWKSPISFYTNILNHNPKVDRVRHNLAMTYSDLGELDKALEQYEIVMKQTNQFPQTFHNVGRIYLLKGDLARAEDFEQKAIALDPKFFPAFGSLFEIYQKMGNEIKAQEAYEKYQKLTH